MSIRNHILSRAPKAPELVPLGIPAWGEGVFVKKWNAAERDDWDAAQQALKATGDHYKNLLARFLVACLVDADAKPLFSTEDAAELGKLPRAEVWSAFDKATDVNTMSGEEKADISKNS